MVDSEEYIIAQNVYGLGFVGDDTPHGFNAVAALLALQSHGKHAVISVCMVNRAKQVTGCAAGSFVGQAIYATRLKCCFETDNSWGNCAQNLRVLGNFSRNSFTKEHIELHGKCISA